MKEKLYFIICVKHFLNCHSYEFTWNLLKQTLRSISGQNSNNFDIIIVSHQTLDDFKTDPFIKNTHFIELDWEPISKKDQWQIGSQIPLKLGREQVLIDKGSKYIIGLKKALKIGASKDSYVMFVDADDFISNNLLSYINDNSNYDHFFIKKGFLLGANNSYRDLNDFGSYCGTCNITKLETLCGGINFSLIKGSRDSVIKSTKGFWLKRILGSHVSPSAYFLKKGLKVDFINIRLAVYNCSHNENHSGVKIKTYKKKVDKKMREEFNIPELNHKQ